MIELDDRPCATTARSSRAAATAYLDSGAYCGEGGFFAQMAAMHADRPVPDRERRRRVVPHLHEHAAELLDPRAHRAAGGLGARAAPRRGRRADRPRPGRAAPAHARAQRRRRGQRAADRARRRRRDARAGADTIGYDERGSLPDDEAIGFACGWWPCFANETGAYVKLNGDGTGTIVTGAQENGTGSVMAFPLFAAEVLGMDASQFSITYQDTDAAPWDAGSSGSQTTFNGGRAVIEAAEDIREQLLDDRRGGARGEPRGPRARRRRHPGQGLPGHRGDDRRRSSAAASSTSGAAPA